jgi:hypothetical protein
MSIKISLDKTLDYDKVLNIKGMIFEKLNRPESYEIH